MSYYDDFVEPNCRLRMRPAVQKTGRMKRIPCPVCGKHVADDPRARRQHADSDGHEAALDRADRKWRREEAKRG